MVILAMNKMKQVEIGASIDIQKLEHKHSKNFTFGIFKIESKKNVKAKRINKYIGIKGN